MSRNEITGDSLHSGGSSDAYRDGWDRIFGKKPKLIEQQSDVPEVVTSDEEQDEESSE